MWSYLEDDCIEVVFVQQIEQGDSLALLLHHGILATVATQAARNSRSAEGVRPDGSPVPVFFCATHPAMTIAISAANTLNSDFPAIVIMVLIVG